MTALEYTVTTNPNPTPAAEIASILGNPGFGKYFTDHMVTIDWNEEKGWHDAQVRPYGPFSMDPASNIFHYGQAIFEGIKAYRQADDSVATFRPDANAKRMQSSARRLAMPELPEEDFIESLRQIVSVDKAWVPAAGGEAALYLRPFLISTEVSLGVHPASSYRYVLIASPAGAYFAGGIKPVSVWLSTDYVRAAPGGTGAAKFAGNYAGSLLAQAQAAEKGCDQVVWLDAIERTFIEEMGGMNLAFIYGAQGNQTLVTPALSGSLLPGITRSSLLQVAQDMGLKTQERRITYQEWEKDVASGAMTEAFACGTAAVITPVGHVMGNETDFIINNNEAGQTTLALRKRLTGIQRGTVEDTHGWMHKLVD